MNPTPAYERFRQSQVPCFDQWHDGTGFDQAAIAEMTPAERVTVRRQLAGVQATWREIEALEVLRDHAAAHPEENGVEPAGHELTPRGGEAVRQIDRATARAAASGERDTRLAAAETLHRQGKLPEMDKVIAREISDNMETVADGCVRALRLAEAFPTPAVKQALLYASNFRNETAMHCAALLCYLCGKAKEPFDWSMRPFFLKFHADSNSLTRGEAMAELQAMTGLTLQEPDTFLHASDSSEGK
ncbi:MAG TPA: hypothetical protein VF624_00075 [Tepidisphaeraceae bacterium]|jgi:hypothetical protein